MLTVKFEIYKQGDFKNLEGLTLLVRSYSKDHNHEEVSRYYFKTIDEVTNWIRINFADLSGSKT